MIENAIFGGGDRLNALSAVLVYVYRVKAHEKPLNIDMINDFINSIKSKSVEVNNLKLLVSGMMTGEIDKSTLLDAITLTLDKDSIYTSKLKQLIKADLTTQEVTKYIKTTTPMIIESTKVNMAFGAIGRASYKLNTSQLDDAERKKVLLTLREELTGLEDAESTGADSDTMEAINISDDGILQNLNKARNGNKIFLKTGWEDLNTGLSGHLATGEFVAVEAQQHKNKTGFTLSLVLQTIFNNRVTFKDGKKPTWLWISLEDDLNQVIVKMFVYIYFRKFKRMPSADELSDNSFVNKFIKESIAETGHELIFYRINPDKFNLDRFKNMVKTYETAGLRVVCAAIDYLEKAYTDGTMYNTGATGSGLKNLVTKFRTYTQEANILTITPWQISTDANNLTRAGVTDREFVKSVLGKNYTQGTKGLAQELDIEIIIHLCRIGGIDYQAVQIGKFKRASTADASDKYMLIPFEKNMKIGNEKITGPLMEDCSASNMIMKDDDKDNGGLDL